MRIHLLIAAAGIAAAQNRTFTDAEVMKVHRSALLIDTHNDITSRTVEGFDIGPRNTSDRPTHTDLVRMKEGGMGAQFFAVYVAAQYVDGNHSANRTLQMIDTVRHDIIAKYPNDFAFATTAAEIEAAHKRGKIAALMGIEGGHAIEDSLRLLRDYYALGVRYMTLTHSNTNNWADSSGDIDSRRRCASQRPHGFRQGCGSGDEPARHDGGYFTRRRQDLLGRARSEQGADLRVAFVVPRAGRRAAQHDR